MFIKITNLIDSHGICNYKGLDIDLFIPGSQVYDMNIAYIATEEIEIPEHSDIQVLTEEEYVSFTNEIKNRPQPPTEMELLQAKLAQQDAVIEELMFDIIPNLLG